MKRCMLVWVLLLGMLAFPALAQDTNVTDGCVQQYDPQADYFPDKSAPDYASGFSIEYHNNFKVVTVLTPWPGASSRSCCAALQVAKLIPETCSIYTRACWSGQRSYRTNRVGAPSRRCH